uniref:Uncharacterized protein n=1 Tax=Ditylenchus dipsaci TaxID=166011 RepID=A0A915EI46_9BILA
MARLRKEHKAELDGIQLANVSTQTRLEALRKEHVAVTEKYKLVEEALQNTIEKHQRTEKMLRSELDMLQHKYNEQFVQFSDIQQKVSSREESIIALQQQLQDTKSQIGDSLKREEALEKKLQEAENRISKSAQMIQKLYSDLEEMSEQSESINLQAETELAKMRLETTRLSEENMTISQDLDRQLRMNGELEHKLKLAESSLQQQEAQIVSLQETYQQTKEEKIK